MSNTEVGGVPPSRTTADGRRQHVEPDHPRADHRRHAVSIPSSPCAEPVMGGWVGSLAAGVMPPDLRT
jgi:hypothetical protein